MLIATFSRILFFTFICSILFCVIGAKLPLPNLNAASPPNIRMTDDPTSEIFFPPPSPPPIVKTMQSVEDTWRELGGVGESLSKLSTMSLLWRSVVGGIFVGFGGVLAASVGFDMGMLAWEPNNGLSRLLSGAIGFPLSILLVTISGAGAWTGDVLPASRAWQEKRTKTVRSLRHLVLTWLGSSMGAALMGAFCAAANLPACDPSITITAHKLAQTSLEVFLRAIGGGVLISMAVFMSRVNTDMVGKVLSIWFPISTYVICDYDHVLASIFFFACEQCSLGKWARIQMRD